MLTSTQCLDQFAEIAADRERAEGLGLAFGQTGSPQKEETDG